MGWFARWRAAGAVAAVAVAAISIFSPSLHAGRARSAGGGAIIVWDGDRDVSIQQGSGDTDTIADLGLSDLGHLAVRARFSDGNSVGSLILPDGEVPFFAGARLLLFARDLVTVCAAATAPDFCRGTQYSTVLEVMEGRFETSNFAKQAPFTALTDAEKLALSTLRLIYFDLVQTGTDGVWRLKPADRAIMQAVSDRFGASNVKVGVMSREAGFLSGFLDLEVVNLAPPAGATFSSSNGPQLPGSSASLPLASIVDLDAGTGNTLYAATATTQLQVSTNAGRTWSNGSDTRRVLQLAVNPANRAHLLAVFQQTTAGSNHVGLSTNGGTSWTTLSMPSTALANGGIAWAAFDPFTSGKIYAFGNGRFLSSVNSGSTWTDTAIGFTPSEPAFSTIAGTLIAVSQSGATRGVWVTTNGGATWGQAPLSLSSSTTTLYVAHSTQRQMVFVAEGRRVHRSIDGAWTSTDVLPSGTITSLAVEPDPCTSCVPTPRVYAGTDRGIYFSAGGLTWTPLLNLQPAGASHARVTAIVPAATLTFGTQAGVWIYDALEQTGTQPFFTDGGWGMLALTGAPASTVTKDVDWLSLVTAPSIAAGDATVVFRVLSTDKFFTRTGYLDVAGRSVGVSQGAIGCDYTLSAHSLSVAASGTSGSVTVTTTFGCTWRAVSDGSHVTLSNGPEFFDSGTVNFTVAANNTTTPRTTTISLAGRTYTISQDRLPTLTAAKSSLRFTAVRDGNTLSSKTADESVRLTQSGAGTLPWTASANQSWLTVTPASDTGSEDLKIGIQFSSALPLTGTATGTVTVKASGSRTDTMATIGVTVEVRSLGTTIPPIGAIDTPLDNSTGVTGSIAVTGWAVDDVGIVRVRILRDPVAGEGTAMPYIGDAVPIDGARPDVLATFPSHPQASRAGWGYLLLTNFLPNLGTGTFRLHAMADDAEGNSRLIGTRTITCTNSVATLPFGAIDTPAQGETVSGIVANFGWVLSPGTRRADPPHGTVSVIVDGVTVGAPVGWTARPDLTALFPAGQFAGIGSALGVYSLDTTSLSNAVHTIAWIVTDNQGGAAGIGSRYFTAVNGSSLTLASSAAATSAVTASLTAGPAAGFVEGRRGFDLSVPMQRYGAGADGWIVVQAEELDRIELAVGPGSRGVLRTPLGDRPLPIGSRLDPETGIFTWQPGVGFVGGYDLAFVAPQASHSVRIVLNPQGSARVGPQLVIDTPRAETRASGPFIVAGWAADLDATGDSGVSAVHVWAYPVGAGDPVFLGAAEYGGDRPDVAAVYGRQFLKSGYGIPVTSLPPGGFDIAVFPYSSVRHRFMPARVVRVYIGEDK